MTTVQVEFETDVFTTLRKSPEEVANDIRLGAAIPDSGNLRRAESGPLTVSRS